MGTRTKVTILALAWPLWLLGVIGMLAIPDHDSGEFVAWFVVVDVLTIPLSIFTATVIFDR